jgi:peptidoglycan/xylan/chitin deacetylase (PgdA/CDA1 family)
MKKKHILSVKFLILCFIIIPVAGICFGNLNDIRYKIKGIDGNRLWDLMGGGSVVRGTEIAGKITFTFDDGPDHRTTPVLLNMLDKFNVKAAFFVNGYRFHNRTAGGEENRAVLREIYKRGHFIGNHTFSHKDITGISSENWNHEIGQVSRQVEEIIGKRLWLFRPPFGRNSAETLKKLEKSSYTVVMWNLDPLDWKARTPRELLARVQKVISENPEGGILLMHDTGRVTVEAFPLIMEWLIDRNAKLHAMGRPGLEIVGLDQFVKR